MLEYTCTCSESTIAAGNEGSEAAPVSADVVEMPELYRLRAIVDEIAAMTDLVPSGCEMVTGDGEIVPNPLFPGLEFPDKLESYVHQHSGPKGASAALTADACACAVLPAAALWAAEVVLAAAASTWPRPDVVALLEPIVIARIRLRPRRNRLVV